MDKKRDWLRETRESINTGFRIPKELYCRFQRYQNETCANKTEIMIAALDAYLPHYDEEGGGDE